MVLQMGWAWRFCKRGFLDVAIENVSETWREIVTFLQPYIFAKWTVSDGRESILSV